MAATTADGVDIDKAGKYPIVLSDSLLGKPSRDLYTSIRYNYKPTPTTSTSTSDLHLQPSPLPSTNYDLSFNENELQYDYNGTRSTGTGQYVLLFDPEKKHFVLHRLDSTFDMNLTSAPWTDDAAILREQYPQLEASQTKPVANRRGSKAKGGGIKKRGSVGGGRKVKKPSPELRKPSPEPEDEDEESDDGLEIEYPGGPMQSQNSNVFSSPAFGRDVSESEEDGDAENDIFGDKGRQREREQNQDVDLLQLPSPMNGGANGNGNGGLSEDDIEADLEAELEQALQAEIGSVESDESEEE